MSPARPSVNDHLDAALHVAASPGIRDLFGSGGSTVAEASRMLQHEEHLRLDRHHALVGNQPPEQNELAYTAALPVEIISRIFFCAVHPVAEYDFSYWLLGLANPARNSWPPSFRSDGWIKKLQTLMQVCRFWREIALETAPLWTHIFPVKTCGVQLERAKSYPLSLWIEEGFSWASVRDLIRPYVPSLRTLRITLQPYEALDFEEVVDEAIAGASNLQHLTT